MYLLRQELPNDAYGPQGVPAWQLELEDRDRKNTYVRVDETGEQETTNDPRDTLASEMADLKSRKIMGEQKRACCARKRPGAAWRRPGVQCGPPAIAVPSFPPMTTR